MKVECMLAPEVAADLLNTRVAIMRSHMEAAAKQDPDGIHDMRVASRRIRAFLTSHGPLLPSMPLERFRNRVQRITVALGTPRELDVCIELLADHEKELRGAAPAAYDYVVSEFHDLWVACAGQIGRAVQLAQSPHFETLLGELRGAIAVPDECYLDHAAASLRKRLGKLRRAHKQWCKSESEEQLHELRKRFKKLRYACELFCEHYGEPVKTFIQRLKKVQQALGDWNDWRVLRDYVRDMLDRAAPALVDDAEQLVSAIQGEVDGHLAHFHKAADVFFVPTLADDAKAMLRPPEAICPKRNCARLIGR